MVIGKNFVVKIVEYYPCKNEKELKQREQYYIKKYEPTLNCLNAHRTQEEIKERKKETDRKYKQYEKGKKLQRRKDAKKYEKFKNNPQLHKEYKQKKREWGKTD